MKEKKVEIHLWWKCNNSCIHCIENLNIKQHWNKKITEKDILKNLIKYKKLWYWHVSYHWWEPFIQPVFEFALKSAKKLWYKILVVTNWKTLQFEHIAKKYLEYIDELIISIPSVNSEIQKKINQTKSETNFEKIFSNIDKYWEWDLFKINIVLNKLNYKEIWNTIDYLYKKWVKNVCISYPDMMFEHYSNEYFLEKILIPYKEVIVYLEEAIRKSINYQITTKVESIPFCIFNDVELIKYAEDIDHDLRLMVDSENIWKILKTEGIFRNRKHIEECKKCKHNKICWWVWELYVKLMWSDEIKAIK